MQYEKAFTITYCYGIKGYNQPINHSLIASGGHYRGQIHCCCCTPPVLAVQQPVWGAIQHQRALQQTRGGCIHQRIMHLSRSSIRVRLQVHSHCASHVRRSPALHRSRATITKEPSRTGGGSSSGSAQCQRPSKARRLCLQPQAPGECPMHAQEQQAMHAPGNWLAHGTPSPSIVWRFDMLYILSRNGCKCRAWLR